MHAKLRRFTPAVLGVLAFGLVWASLAWACTINAHLAARAGSGPAGTQVTTAPGTRVTLIGDDFVPHERVEFRWYTQQDFMTNQRVITQERGPLVGTARVEAGGDFVARVRIPEEAAGPHRIVASANLRYGRDHTRNVGVDVEAPEHYGAGKTQPFNRKSNRTFAPDASRPRGERGSGSATGPRKDGAGGRGKGTSSSSAPGGLSRGGVEGASPSSGPEVFPGSVPPTPAAQRQGASPPGAPAPAGGPSERSATGDLWSGFGAGNQASLLPSMTDPEVPEEGPGSQLAIGVGLLGLGLLALLSGFGAAEVRRRRALAGRAD